MIHKIYFKNFYSFMGEVDLRLSVNKNAPQTDAYFVDSRGHRLTKLLALVGPNASGKTNLLKSIAFIKWFVEDSFASAEPDEDIAFKPFLFCSKIDSTVFDIEFETNQRVYKYELELNTKQVLKEKLSVKKEKRFSSLFDRKWDEKQKEYRLNGKEFNLPSDFSQLTRGNASVLSAARQIKHKESLEILSYFRNIQTNIVEGGKLPMDAFGDAIEFYKENPEAKEKAEDILSKFDLGLSKINIEKVQTQNNNEVFYRASGSHRYVDSDKVVLLPFRYESAGTKNLLFLLRTILIVLARGGVAVLDEMDNDLHPLMVPEIINLFTSSIYNPNNAQLLFSTHSVQILNKLDKQQVVLVEKSKNGVSEAWSLSDIKGVRADDNFYAKYMAGAYGAIPEV